MHVFPVTVLWICVQSIDEVVNNDIYLTVADTGKFGRFDGEGLEGTQHLSILG